MCYAACRAHVALVASPSGTGALCMRICDPKPNFFGVNFSWQQALKKRSPGPTSHNLYEGWSVTHATPHLRHHQSLGLFII